jgi:hypothetical protein
MSSTPGSSGFSVSKAAPSAALSVQPELQSRWMKPTNCAGLRRIVPDTNLKLPAVVFFALIPTIDSSLLRWKREWNAKLRALSEAEQNCERQRQSDQLKISAAQREQVLALVTDFPRLWNDPGTANRERKRMVRLAS